MKKYISKMIDILISLEPEFRKAGKLACEMQSTTLSHNKTSSGIMEVDIVTEADIKVQEMILKTMAKTELTECKMMAEEDTSSVGKFNQDGKLIITLDPIDGTSLYSKGKKFFSLIIGLHNKQELLYSYYFCPKINWAVRIVDNKITFIGEKPKINLPKIVKESIIYTYGNPKETAPKLFKQFHGKFQLRKNLTRECGSTFLLLNNKVAGFYTERPNVYDGFVALHFAKTMKYKIITNQSSGKFDISNIAIDKRGFYYPGYYLVLK